MNIQNPDSDEKDKLIDDEESKSKSSVLSEILI